MFYYEYVDAFEFEDKDESDETVDSSDLSSHVKIESSNIASKPSKEKSSDGSQNETGV